ncbi:MAG: class I SAM-dependent methyltransferase [Candidatus Omnitrophota bacterium]
MHKELQFKKEAGYYGNQGDDLIKLVPGSAKRILDIGCGPGIIGKRLKESGNREVVGIEVNPVAAEEAKRNLDRVYVADVEAAKPFLATEYFDCIIFGDVLEHLVNPWQVIKDMKAFLANGGYIIISLPNISHWAVVKGLLSGNWEYKGEGTLDITHLRFFTLKSVRKMLEDAGFVVERDTCRLACNKFFKKINKLLNGKITHLLAWQYLIAAKKP